MNDNAETANRRDSLRLRRLKSAKIVFNNASSIIDCVLRDISDTGAKLETENAAHLPKNLILKVGDEQSFDCEVMWRSERQLGVRFRNNESLRHLSGFLASMAHELHTPLGAIIGFAEAIDAGRFGPLSHPKYAKQLRRIIDGGRGLTVAINELLALSNVDAGGIVTPEVLIEPPALFEAAVALAVEFSDRPDADVRLEQIDALPQIRGNEIKLQQIMVSVLSDAIGKAGKDGRVRVTAAVDAGGSLDIAVDHGGADLAATPPVTAPMVVLGDLPGANDGGVGTLSGLGMADALCRSCGIELVAGRIPGGGRVRLRLPRERVIQ